MLQNKNYFSVIEALGKKKNHQESPNKTTSTSVCLKGKIPLFFRDLKIVNSITYRKDYYIFHNIKMLYKETGEITFSVCNKHVIQFSSFKPEETAPQYQPGPQIALVDNLRIWDCCYGHDMLLYLRINS